jgi:hypothetical protein
MERKKEEGKEKKLHFSVPLPPPSNIVIQKLTLLRHTTVTKRLVIGSNLSEIPVMVGLFNCDVSAERSIYHQEE